MLSREKIKITAERKFMDPEARRLDASTWILESPRNTAGVALERVGINQELKSLRNEARRSGLG